MSTRSTLSIVVGIAILGGQAVVHAQNCSLRNPDRQIFAMFPDATSYKSLVQAITPEIRADIEAALGSPLRLRDVGKHTAYIALEGAVPLGFVHARAEIGKRGAMELVWAYDLDLTLIDFSVQRCRERKGDLIRSDSFRAKLVGTDLKGIRSFLTQGNQSVDLQALGLPDEAESIASTIVLCGATTRVVTEMAFGSAVFNARLLGNVHRFSPQTAKVTRIKTPLAADVSVTPTPGSSEARAFDPDSLVVLRSLSPEQRTIGGWVFAKWSAHPAAPEVWLAVSASGAIVSAVIVGDVDETTRTLFSDLVGKRLPLGTAVSDRSADSPFRCAAELLAVLKTHGIGG